MEPNDRSPPPSPYTRSFHFTGSPPPSPLALYCSSSTPPTSPTEKKVVQSTSESSPSQETGETQSATTPTSSLSGKEPQCPSMVNQFFKLLLRKHSSGDLHSRLKTRKLLGVGETDDGDIHRSKLSQILGHSDQLYIRLPYGLRVWQLLLAIMFSVVGAWAIILPSHLFQSALEVGEGDHVTLPIRLYGGALVSLSLVFWVTLSSQDRDTIRMCLLASIVYFTIQIVVSALSPATLSSPISTCLGDMCHVIWRAGQDIEMERWNGMDDRGVKDLTLGHLLVYSRSPEQRYNLILLLGSRAAFALISVFYQWALTQRKFCPGNNSSSLRRNNSTGRDLGAAGGFGSGGGGGRAVTAAALYNGSSSSSGSTTVGGSSGDGGAVGGNDDAGAAGAGLFLGDRVKSKDV
ncbi:tumor protein p53-inducible protein 11 [Plakobranchus ocellatus]|uniref:Tumor protein p53-inducible protein 11 n=1 Tax=Plakobranchus ocellatus TaxID=259542 RepID=A0AAV4A2X3_9GAST|nr:tumor protein p53-inducible protein 11 [Plakobranchus ocellatus]